MDYGCEHPNIVEQDRERRVRLFELAMAGIIPWHVALRV